MTTLDPLQIRKRLDRATWGVPVPFGPDGWQFDTITLNHGRIIVTADVPHPVMEGWIHASISRYHTPSYDDLVLLHQAVWPEGYAYQVFVPPEKHINIHPYALHLWGKADGSPQLPDFGVLGTI